MATAAGNLALKKNIIRDLFSDKGVGVSTLMPYVKKTKKELEETPTTTKENPQFVDTPDYNFTDIDPLIEPMGYSEGGRVDLVKRVMGCMKAKKMSEGGRVANQEHGYRDSKLAGFSPNEFDDLVLRDDLEFSYDAENSGDALSCPEEDERRHDIVKQLMRSLSKKDQMPIAGYGVNYGKHK